MRLTRRDALHALAGMGAVSLLPDTGLSEGDTVDPLVHDLVAIAEVLYPTAVTVGSEYIQTYVSGRAQSSNYSIEEVESLVAEINRQARRSTGREFAALPARKRDYLLRDIGASNAFPDPDGTVPERIRYYIVNDLLYALYTTPTGGTLVGFENPDGYPGGLEAYQRGVENE